MLDRKVDIHGEITRRSILEINEADKSVVKGQHFNWSVFKFRCLVFSWDPDGIELQQYNKTLAILYA